MTVASFYLSRTRPICLARPSHRDVVAAPLRTPCYRSVEAIAAPPKHRVDVAFVVHEAPQLPRANAHPATLRHRGSLNPHSPGAVRAV
jgi:hypothetical protein